ncbi:putative mitochondrial protein AtMg00860 [Nicotiana tabacum]|uniref:Mitochondrial protein AtMg00860 n=1 Tax=Nicotiana tabacum TaxID=4097 RepID=A0A1S3X0M0_TOBAC
MTNDGIEVDPKKIEAVQCWPRPSTTTEIMSFLGLVGYYRHFMEGLSSIAAPLTKLTQKGTLLRWSVECEESFQKLKTSLTTSSVLALLSRSGLYMVYYDSSHVGLECVLMQSGRVITYALYQLKPHKKNYMVHDFDLAAIVHALMI